MGEAPFKIGDLVVFKEPRYGGLKAYLNYEKKG